MRHPVGSHVTGHPRLKAVDRIPLTVSVCRQLIAICAHIGLRIIRFVENFANFYEFYSVVNEFYFYVLQNELLNCRNVAVSYVTYDPGQKITPTHSLDTRVNQSTWVCSIHAVMLDD